MVNDNKYRDCERCRDVHLAQREGRTTRRCECDCHGSDNDGDCTINLDDMIVWRDHCTSSTNDVTFDFNGAMMKDNV